MVGELVRRGSSDAWVLVTLKPCPLERQGEMGRAESLTPQGCMRALEVTVHQQVQLWCGDCAVCHGLLGTARGGKRWGHKDTLLWCLLGLRTKELPSQVQAHEVQPVLKHTGSEPSLFWSRAQLSLATGSL